MCTAHGYRCTADSTGTAYWYHVSILPHASHLVEHSSLCCIKLVIRELPLLFELSQIFQLLCGGVWLRGSGGFRILLQLDLLGRRRLLEGRGATELGEDAAEPQDAEEDGHKAATHNSADDATQIGARLGVAGSFEAGRDTHT